MMRTKFGEITIGKILVFLFILSAGTLFFTNFVSNKEAYNIFALPYSLKEYFFGLLMYIFFIFLGFFLQIFEFARRVNIQSLSMKSSAAIDKEILKIKKRGFFIYKGGSGWGAKKNECYYNYNQEQNVTAFDRFLYSYGPPFDETWEFEGGLVYWFLMLPFMSSMIIFLILLPFLIIFLI